MSVSFVGGMRDFERVGCAPAAKSKGRCRAIRTNRGRMKNKRRCRVRTRGGRRGVLVIDYPFETISGLQKILSCASKVRKKFVKERLELW